MNAYVRRVRLVALTPSGKALRGEVTYAETVALRAGRNFRANNAPNRATPAPVKQAVWNPCINASLTA